MSDLDPPAAATRIVNAGARAALDQLAGSGLLERGSVTIISVEAIRARAGDRWARKRDDVSEYVSRKFEEHLSISDIRQKISETDFLVAVTTEEGVAAQAISLKILQEVLHFFLGKAEGDDLKLKAVTGIQSDTITCEDVNVAHIVAALSKPSSRSDGQEIDEYAARDRNPISFVTVAGERVRVDFAVEHLINLRHRITAGLRIQPTIRLLSTNARIPSHSLGKLADEDVAFIDRATVRFGSLLLRQDRRGRPPVILPVSFRTMGLRKGRDMFLGLEATPQEHIKHGALIELVDVDRGTPAGRLAEVVTLVGALSRGVMAQVLPGRDAMASITGSRVSGVAIDVGDISLEIEPMMLLCETMAQQMRGQAPAVIAQGLPGRSWLPQVASMGFTHATVRPLGHRDHGPRVATGARDPRI